ncbi:glycosyltransferase family 61 protein [Chryseobacterium polytrichastri]|uniref:Glycosyltransferase 61 catalytic domain-containing protein n=1 Tax=Chryseobacterium polytrichastri TaxID=1302687 RepID=A0A1M6X910_9FLAO|nr:glycosyltransferase family 61 protein [Chryseobacterium polytrichastri]SHL02441.1 Protein of unknown function [Chryseobacterium polytrichastri]
MATIIEKFVAYIKSNDSLSIFFKRAVYNYRYKPNSQIVSIQNIENCKVNIVQKLFDRGEFKNYFPKIFNKDELYNEVLTPEVSLYQFNNAYIDINSSSILLKENLVTFRTKDERFNEGFIKFHNNKHAKIEKKAEIEELNEGLFLGGNGSWNWFHFLIEIIPKLTLFKEQYTNILFVNQIILKIPSMKRILDVLVENKFEIKYLSSEKTYFIKELYYINDFNHVQFNRFDKLITSDGTFYNAEITRNFSNLVSEKLLIKDNLPDKIFLYRKNTHRVAENQDRILEFLKDFGFVAVCLEELSIDEQASYFRTAKFIIGITGAAWSNMLFCRNQPKAICFVPDNAEEFTAFSNLAKIFRVDFYAQLYKNDGAHTNSNFIINFEKFVELFNYVNGK